MESFVPESFEIVERDNALSYWEFVNASDADSDSDFEVGSLGDDDGVTSLHSSLSSSSASHCEQSSLDPVDRLDHVDDVVESVVEETPIGGLDLSFNVNIVRDLVDDDDDDNGDKCSQLKSSSGYGYEYGSYGYGRDYDHDDEDDEEEDDEEEDDDGLDDELVPWSVSGKFGGRQRMRKLGKRAFPKMMSARRALYNQVKPGCLHGKHGLGVKHNY